MKTTLKKIKSFYPCKDELAKLLCNLVEKENLEIAEIFESNGFDFAVWCLRAVDGHKTEIKLFGIEMAKAVQHLMSKEGVKAVEVAELYTKGRTTLDELTRARNELFLSVVGVCSNADMLAIDSTWIAEETKKVAELAWIMAYWNEDESDLQSNLLLFLCNGAFVSAL